MSTSKPKILFVDDEPINLKLFRVNFRSLYTVLTAENGEEGFAVLKEDNEIKIVISDFKMPMMNGIEFAHKVKDFKPHLKFFILTGYDASGEIENAIQSQLITDCFCKPFDVEKMHEIIAENL